MDNTTANSSAFERGGIKIGDIVISLAGHDAGSVFIVTAELNADFVLIADGKSRTIESPKLKRKKHLRVVGQASELDSTNASLYKRLKKFISDRRLYAEK